MTTRITKVCKTLRQAENFQNRLYDQYQSLALVKAPMFGEEGEYVWRASNDEHQTPTTRTDQ